MTMSKHGSDIAAALAAQWNLRRGTALAALGTALALSAGVPASQATTPTPSPGTPSASISVGIDDLIGGLTDPPSPSPTSGTAGPAPAPSTAPPTSATPSPSGTPEQQRPRRGTRFPSPPGTTTAEPLPAAPQPSTRQPTGTQAPEQTDPTAPDRPTDAATGDAALGTVGPGTVGTLGGTPGRDSAPGAAPRASATLTAGTASPDADATSGGSIRAVSAVEPLGRSALVGWGFCLVAVSLGSAAAVLQLRRI